MKNKSVGAKVLIKKVLLRINPKEGWVYQKKVTGVIVPKEDDELYSYTASGGHTSPTKHIFKEKGGFNIKLDNDLVDIAGNNIVPVREWDIEFLETLPKKVKVITEKEYLRALKIVKEYEKVNSI